MGGVSTRVCLVNTGIQTFLPHGNGLLFTKNDSLPGPDMTRPPAEICRLIETSLRHLHISAYGHAIESSVKSFYNYRTMTCFPLLHAIQSGLPLRIFFCKGLSALPNGKPETSNLPQTGLSVFAVPSFALLPANTLEKQKISLGQAGKLETKGKKIQSVWHRLTRT